MAEQIKFIRRKFFRVYPKVHQRIVAHQQNRVSGVEVSFTIFGEKPLLHVIEDCVDAEAPARFFGIAEGQAALLRVVGEDVSEMLDLIAAQLKVVQIARPKKSCRRCERMVQVPAPSRPISGSMVTLCRSSISDPQCSQTYHTDVTSVSFCGLRIQRRLAHFSVCSSSQCGQGTW